MQTISSLFAGVALAALATPAAFAQAAPETPVAAPAEVQADPAPETSSDIVVLGFGQSRQVQSVSAVDLARLTPGSSPLKAIEKLPGVNFQASDPFGAYEWAVAHLAARVQPEPARLHARRRAARRHELRQRQRPAHQPRDHLRERRPHRSRAGRRRARHRIDQQSRRHDPVLQRQAARHRQRHRRRHLWLGQHVPRLCAASTAAISAAG